MIRARRMDFREGFDAAWPDKPRVEISAVAHAVEQIIHARDQERAGWGSTVPGCARRIKLENVGEEDRAIERSDADIKIDIDEGIEGSAGWTIERDGHLAGTQIDWVQSDVMGIEARAEVDGIDTSELQGHNLDGDGARWFGKTIAWPEGLVDTLDNRVGVASRYQTAPKIKGTQRHAFPWDSGKQGGLNRLE